MNDTEVPPDIACANAGPLELPVLLIGEIGHGALELGDDCAGCEMAGCENTELGLAGLVSIAGGVSDFNRAGGVVELQVAGSVAGERERERVFKGGKGGDGREKTHVAKALICFWVYDLRK